MKRKILALVIALVAAMTPVFVSSYVSAQSTQPQNPTPTTQTEEEEEEEEPVVGALCERVQTRLIKRINSVDTVHEAHSKAYDRLLKRLDTIIDNAETKSYDTTQLSDARETIAAAIGEYDKAVAGFTETVGTSAEVSCENPARYGILIASARAQLKTIRESEAVIRSAFRTEALPSLKEYKEWLVAERSGENN